MIKNKHINIQIYIHPPRRREALGIGGKKRRGHEF
jgi:hypothetical protein